MTLTAQQLTLEQLITQLNAAEPETAVYQQPTRTAPSAEAVADAFDALNGIFTYSRSEDSLRLNEAATLSETEAKFANASIAAFNDRLNSSSLVIDRAANGDMVPTTAVRVTEGQGVRIDLPETSLTAGAPVASATGCTWQWWFNTYWWGFKFSFNSCAINWLSTGGKVFDEALKAFHLPAIVTPIVKLVAAILKPFDKGNGSTIYFTWIGAIWVTAK